MKLLPTQTTVSNRRRNHTVWFLAGILLLVNGCAALEFQKAEVSFPHPFFGSDFSGLTPNEAESEGVLLRFKKPETGELRYRENNRIFARTRQGKGLRLLLDMEKRERFLDGSTEESFLRETETTIQRYGHILEKYDMSPSGAILKFIEGRHSTDSGKFQVLEMKRSAVFPDHPVRAGDRWTHEEELVLKLESFWVKQNAPSRHRLVAESELKGFTTLGGNRVAVIHTLTEEKAAEELTVLFKQIRFEVKAELEEILHFDYENGRIVQKLVNTKSHTFIPQVGLSDEGKSQMISQLVREESEH